LGGKDNKKERRFAQRLICGKRRKGGEKRRKKRNYNLPNRHMKKPDQTGDRFPPLREKGKNRRSRLIFEGEKRRGYCIRGGL